jgi:hypothetical protein
MNTPGFLCIEIASRGVHRFAQDGLVTDVVGE